MGFRIYSPAFANEARIPDKYTCESEDISPPLKWEDPPADTRSFVLLCEDPDAPNGTWRHWALYNLPANVDHLDEGYAKDAQVGETRQTTNDFGRTGYGGPEPPIGHGIHHYHFRLLALSVDTLDVPPDAGYQDVESAAMPYALDVASVVGLYSRE